MTPLPGDTLSRLTTGRAGRHEHDYTPPPRLKLFAFLKKSTRHNALVHAVPLDGHSVEVIAGRGRMAYCQAMPLHNNTWMPVDFEAPTCPRCLELTAPKVPFLRLDGRWGDLWPTNGEKFVERYQKSLRQRVTAEDVAALLNDASIISTDVDLEAVAALLNEGK